MNHFDMQDINKLSLVNRIIEWESKGYEPMYPVAEVNKNSKDWDRKDMRYRQEDFKGVYESVIYKVRMRKVE